MISLRYRLLLLVCYGCLCDNGQVLSRRKMRKNVEEYISTLKDLKNLVLMKLLTTPLEVLQRQEYLDNLQKHISELTDLERQLQMELDDETRIAQQQVIMTVQEFAYEILLLFASCIFVCLNVAEY